MNTPSTELATKILDRLTEAGLLRQADQKNLLSNLANGKLKPEDWRLAIELSSSVEEKR